MSAASSGWLWLRRVAAVVIVYFAWGVGYDLLADTVWLAVAVSLVGGALAGWVAPASRWPAVGVVVAAAVDTVGALFVAADAPGGDDLIQRALSLVVVLAGVLAAHLLVRRDGFATADAG